MKLVLSAILILLAAAAHAEIPLDAPSGDLTLGGIPRLIGDKLKEAKPCGLVDFSGHIGGGAYLPIWTFHDKNQVSYVEALDIGYRAIQGQKPSIILMPAAFNVTGLSGRVWDFQWAHDHLTRSQFPAVFLGVAPILPLDSAQIKALKIVRPQDWLGAVASARF